MVYNFDHVFFNVHGEVLDFCLELVDEVEFLVDFPLHLGFLPLEVVELVLLNGLDASALLQLPPEVLGLDGELSLFFLEVDLELVLLALHLPFQGDHFVPEAELRGMEFLPLEVLSPLQTFGGFLELLSELPVQGLQLFFVEFFQLVSV